MSIRNIFILSIFVAFYIVPCKTLNSEFGYCKREFKRDESKIKRLHTEIEQFHTQMLSTRENPSLRIRAINRIEAVILNIWPHAQAKLFGSFRSGLYLTSSDTDLVVLYTWDSFALRKLETELFAMDIAEPNSIVVSDKNVVPLLRFTEAKSQMVFDIVFNEAQNPRKAEILIDYKHKYPALSKLFFVLKKFLIQCNLNTPFTGGLSSFALALMLISFLQTHPTYKPYEHEHLGVLLLDFFELHGQTLNYNKQCISIELGGECQLKQYIKREWMRGRQNITESSLCVKDPIEKHVYIGGNYFRILDVRRAFQAAYVSLSIATSSTFNDTIDGTQNCILGRIIDL